MNSPSDPVALDIEGKTLPELFVELELLSEGRMSAGDWRDLLALPPDLQGAVLASKRAVDWTRPSTPTGRKILAVLDVVGRVASDVGTVAGAAGAIAALTAL